MTVTARVAGAIDRMSTGKRRLLGLSLVRIGMGVALLSTYLTNFKVRYLIWGPDAVSGYQSFVARTGHGGPLSLYALSDGRVWFNLVFYAGILVTAVWTVYGGRALTVACAVFLWSLNARDYATLDGGDNLAQILIIFLCFTTTDYWLSPRGGRVRRREALRNRRTTLGNSLHNCAALVVVVQTSMVYLVSGLWKVSGEHWRDGSALYYISRVHEYSHLSVFPWLMGHMWLSLIASYVTIAAQLCAVPAVFSTRPWFRKLVFSVIAVMHVGIMFGMGLFSFALVMLAADTAILRDSDYRLMRAWLDRHVLARLATLRRRAHRGSAEPVGRPAPPGEPAPAALSEVGPAR
ncbi:hypothetical protein ACFV3R_19630 [Streptomyces sp. NPDC059740]|uniref:hypothetical protein n=1 Tax=Streptomyces sp. NPDC059740 TaxID=3346926 RepID=UPI0036646582